MFQNKIKSKIFILILLFFIGTSSNILAAETEKNQSKFPDYSYEYIGKDKYENFNRKMFVLNQKLNKYAIRPAHVLWASIMPKYGMDRLQYAYRNIEYPKRVVSCLVQKDFKASKNETIRFLTNTTIGLGGMFDPAKRFLKIEPVEEDMEQALAKCKIKRGPYLVLPVLSSTTPRAIAGKLLDTSLDPTVYVASPLTALVKFGLMLNKTAYMQPLSIMMERTYADPYDIAKKLYGIENYIKTANLDRKEVLDTAIKFFENPETQNVLDVKDSQSKDDLKDKNDLLLKAQGDNEKAVTEEETAEEEPLKGGTFTDNIVLKDINPDDSSLEPDLLLKDYKPQSPVVDSMRTALFDIPGIDDSMWSEISIWNRCFSKKIKTDSVSLFPEREEYNYKYIMQKEKNSPLAIIYPSVGEGISSHHSVVLAKIFYDKGYSVIIQGSHFHWEFVKSAPKDYRPGIPANDAHHLKLATGKIIESLQNKYKCHFEDKIVIGTSFGAMTTLFLASSEYQDNTLNISKYISINPPIELIYAIKQLDRNNSEWNKNPNDLKQRVALTAAKIVQIAQMKDEGEKEIERLPFTEEEGKLITGFLLRQKLSDLVFTIENTTPSKKCDIYKSINDMSYEDYAKKYLISDKYKNMDEMSFDTSLHSIANYLRNNNNYKIYHTPDDYFINRMQLKRLREYAGKNLIIVSNGSHLGFLYRKEFMDSLISDITPVKS